MLTKKKAIEISIELWTWLAETGSEEKGGWSGWNGYGVMQGNCALCEYDAQKENDCLACPINCSLSPFARWWYANTIEERKKYASLFLEQLKELI